jgi:hypothetical protein
MQQNKKPIRIKTLAALNKVTSNGKVHRFRILLAGGLIYSEKLIRRMGDMYYIDNRIDDSSQELHEDEIMDENLTNIGKAMKAGAFILL